MKNKLIVECRHCGIEVFKDQAAYISTQRKMKVGNMDFKIGVQYHSLCPVCNRKLNKFLKIGE